MAMFFHLSLIHIFTAGRIEGKQLLMFYTSLHTMGINAIVVREGENETLIQLEELVKRIEQPEGKVWVENPSLHLTALYFMQEFRKQPNQQITGQMRQLQEEIAANFEKARFIMAVSTEEKGLPLVKLNNGDVFQPVFTDVLEFQKFNRENKFRPVVIESQKLPQVLAKEAKGVVLNPIGINMPMLLNKRVQGQPQADVQAQPQPDVYKRQNETFPSFVQQYLPKYGRPEVEKIENLPVTIVIDQKKPAANTRSTVGTYTDIYALLRLLFSRVGKPFVGYSDSFSFNHPAGKCPRCDGLGMVTDLDIHKLVDFDKCLNDEDCLLYTSRCV